MSLLSADDSFRPRRFDASPSINALLIPIEDSIYQYSQAQTQRRTQAQQWIESKEAKDDGNDNNKIEATISEDLADGQTGKLDAALKLLSDDELRLLIPSDELEDDEIHIIETQFGAPQGGNHSLQDYQMQLMLLEQQNKKRLLLARQAQDNQGYDNNRTQIARRVHEKRFSDRMKTSKVTKSNHLSPIMPQTRSVTRPRTAVGKRKLDDESQEQQPNKSARDTNSNDSNAIQGLNTDRRDLSEVRFSVLAFSLVELGLTGHERTYHLTLISSTKSRAHMVLQAIIPCQPSGMLPSRTHHGMLLSQTHHGILSPRAHHGILSIMLLTTAVPISTELSLFSIWKLSWMMRPTT
jgi:hypothetical protein